jgi:transcriptional regulator with XRE-family HTH domain
MNLVGLQVRHIRKSLGLKLDALCGRVAAATGGAWVPTWRDAQRIERGERIVSDFELIALAAALEVELSDLLDDEINGVPALKRLALKIFNDAVGQDNPPSSKQ